MGDFLRREQRLLLAIAAVAVLMNVPVGRYALYPFLLFSTWVHEMCHGVAALALGGEIAWLKVFPDGSGLASTARPPGRMAPAFVASAGYIGTALVGGTLLALRRVRVAGRVGTTALGLTILLSVLLYVRNPFGMASLLAIGAGLVLAGWKLPDEASGLLYAVLAATCCLNAVTSIQTLFSSQLRVGGQAVSGSDAHTVAEVLLLPYWFWAVLWMAIALLATVAGLWAGAPRGASTEA